MRGFFSGAKNKPKKKEGAAGSSSGSSFDHTLAVGTTDASFAPEDGHFNGGSWKRCVEYLFIRDSDATTRALLYCFRPFATPAELLAQVTAIHEAPQSQLQGWGKHAVSADTVKARLTSMLLEWVNIAFFFDFQPDPKLVAELHATLKNLLPSAEHNRIKLILLKGKVDPHGLRFPDDLAVIAAQGPQVGELMQGARYFLQQEVDSIAAELSSIDYELYRSIEASELMNKNWQRENANELSPNLVELRKRFNQLSFWAISIILEAETKALQLRMAKHLLECAWALYQLRNYNGMGAIVSGLSSISVSRLKYLWEGFTKSESKRWEELMTVLEVQQNFKQYRALLVLAAKQELTCIPYLPLHLRDILTIYEREDNHLTTKDASGASMVNFDKMRALGLVMHTILQFRGTKWKTSHDSTLREYLLHITFLSEDDLLLRSDEWKATESGGGDSTPGTARGPKSSDGSAPLSLQAPTAYGRVAILVHFETWAIHTVFPLYGTFKDLKKLVRSVTGRDCDMYYTTSSGLTMFLDSQAVMPDFMVSNETLTVVATFTRGTIRGLSRGSRPNSATLSTGTVAATRSRSGSSTPVGALFGSPTQSSPVSPAPESTSGPSSPRVSSPELSAAESADGSASSSSSTNKDGVPKLRRGRSRSSITLDVVPKSPSLATNSARTTPHSSSPLMSPRGEEKKRILVLELLDGASKPELAVSAHLTYEELVALVALLYRRGDARLSFVAKDGAGSLVIEDEHTWARVVKAGRLEGRTPITVTLPDDSLAMAGV